MEPGEDVGAGGAGELVKGSTAAIDWKDSDR